MLDKYLMQTPYSLRVSERRAKMLEDLNALTLYHAANCEPYRRILDGLWGGQTSTACVEDVPYLPVSL